MNPVGHWVHSKLYPCDEAVFAARRLKLQKNSVRLFGCGSVNDGFREVETEVLLTNWRQNSLKPLSQLDQTEYARVGASQIEKGMSSLGRR